MFCYTLPMIGSNEPLSIEKGFNPLKFFGHRLQQVILPIFAIADGEIVHLGTGFIITPDGLMITAKHVIEEVFEKRLRKRDGSNTFYKNVELYAMYITNAENKEIPGTTIGGQWPIDMAWYVPELDIAYCWLRNAVVNCEPFKFQTCLLLSPGLPKVDDEILGFGYYKSAGAFTGEKVGEKKVVDYAHETAFTTGKIQEVFFPKLSEFHNFPCFQTTARFEGGMSGGPIFSGSSEKGGVCGVICSAFDGQGEDGEYTSFGSLIWPSLAMTLEMKIEAEPEIERVSVYELAQKGYIKHDNTFNRLEFSKTGDKISVGLRKNP